MCSYFLLKKKCKELLQSQFFNKKGSVFVYMYIMFETTGPPYSSYHNKEIERQREMMVCPLVRRDNPRASASGLSVCTAGQTVLYLTYSMIPSVDLARYEVSRSKDLSFLEIATMNNVDPFAQKK